MKDESRMRYKTLVQSLMVGFNFLKCCWINRPKSNTPGPFVYGSTLISNYYKASTVLCKYRTLTQTLTEMVIISFESDVNTEHPSL